MDAIKFLLSFVCVGFLLFNQHLKAQTAPPKANIIENLAVLNIVAIRNKAAVIQDINQQITKHQNEVRQGIRKEEEVLRLANQDLAKKRAILAPEAYNEERRKFEQDFVKVQQLVQQKKQSLNKAKATALGKVEKILNEIIANIAKERGYSIILRSDQTILSSRKLDITGEVLQRLNKKISSMTVKLLNN